MDVWLLDLKAPEASTWWKGMTLQKHACAQCFHLAVLKHLCTYSAASHPNRVVGLHLILRYGCSPTCCKRKPGNSMQFSLPELLPKEWVKQPQPCHTSVFADPVQVVYCIWSLYRSEIQHCALIFKYPFSLAWK